MTQPATEELNLDELERLANEATPGPWECICVADRQPVVVSMGYSDEEPQICTGTRNWPMTLPEGKFIAASRTAVPALIARIRADTERLRKVRELADEVEKSSKLRARLKTEYFDGEANAYRVMADELRALLDALPDLAAWNATSDEALLSFEEQLDSRGVDVEGNLSATEKERTVRS